MALVKERLNSGGDINEMTDKGTALHVACLYNRVEIGRLLLENGADPRAKDRWGQMPIDIANDREMVALLREFGVTEFGAYQFNQMQREGQRNAVLLGNKNGTEVMLEQLDPIDHFYGFYAPWLSVEHLNVVEEALQADETSADAPCAVAAEGLPRLYLLDSKLLKGLPLDEAELLALAEQISQARPFKKLRAWDKYTVFLFLSQLRSLRLVATKRKLRAYFLQWHESA